MSQHLSLRLHSLSRMYLQAENIPFPFSFFFAKWNKPNSFSPQQKESPDLRQLPALPCTCFSLDSPFLDTGGHNCIEKFRGSLDSVLPHVTYCPSNCFSHLACQRYDPKLLSSPTRMSHRTSLGCFCIKTDESSVPSLVHSTPRAPTLLFK